MAGSLPELWWGLVVLGACAGVLSGALGLGSGTLLIPALVLVFQLPQKSAQGTALAVMVPMAIIGVLRYKLHLQVEVNGACVLLLVAGAAAGALLGTAVAARLPAFVLRRAFAVFLVVVAARMLLSRPSRPPADVPGSARDATRIEATAEKGSDDDGTRR